MIKKQKIVNRLILSYTLLLGIFTVVMLTIFFSLLNEQGLELHKEQMKEQGDVIAETIFSEGYLNKKSKDDSMHGRMMGANNHMSSTNNFLSLISQLSTDEIFVVDTDGEALFSSHMMSDDESQIELPLAGEEVLHEVLEESTIQFLEVDDLSKTYTLGYGVPLYGEDNQQSGAVIVLSQKAHSLTSTLTDYRLLIVSVALALIVTIIISMILAKKFVSPIHKMEKFTDELIAMNYGNELDINTKDELSTLGDKLSILSQRLLSAKKAQDNKEQNQKLFLSQISHELRTPVMVIKNSLEALRGDFLNEVEKQEYIEQLIQETSQLNRLVNDLLELTRLESTEFSINEEAVSLPNICQDSLRSFREIVKQKNQQVVFTSNLVESDKFVGDYQRLSQLIKILLDNSIKYSPKNSEIHVNLEKKVEGIALEVTNPVEKMGNLPDMKEAFTAFTRGNETSDIGHGLGLKIAEEIVKRHNGKIEMALVEDNLIEVTILFMNK